MEINKYIEALGVAEEELKSESRVYKYVFARQIIWYHMRRDLTMVELAEMFNRKHSSVIQAISKIKGYVEVGDKRTIRALALLNEIDSKCRQHYLETF